MRVRLPDSEVVIAQWGSGSPSIVMLHDGLGSIGQWGDVPKLIAERTGATVWAYDRAGHGSSTPATTGPWPPDWMSREAEVLGELLEHLSITDPVLLGHSDGASIALLHATATASSVGGVLALAPHSYVERRCVDAIASMRANPARIVAGLERYHENAAGIFDAWSGGWTNPRFASWDIRDQLGAIAAPTLIVQGADDDYATDAMAQNTAAAVGPNAEWQLLDGVGHLIHRDYPALTVDLIAAFVAAAR